MSGEKRATVTRVYHLAGGPNRFEAITDSDLHLVSALSNKCADLSGFDRITGLPNQPNADRTPKDRDRIVFKPKVYVRGDPDHPVEQDQIATTGKDGQRRAIQIATVWAFEKEYDNKILR